MNKRIWLGFGLGAVAVVALIAVAGVIKFNAIGNDVVLVGTAVTRADLIGDWVEPVPGMEDEVQGFSLHEDGNAASINMATLRYQRWRFDNGELILTGESIGNRTSSTFDEVYRVQSLGQGRVELIDDQGRMQVFVRP